MAYLARLGLFWSKTSRTITTQDTTQFCLLQKGNKSVSGREKEDGQPEKSTAESASLYLIRLHTKTSEFSFPTVLFPTENFFLRSGKTSIVMQ